MAVTSLPPVARDLPASAGLLYVTLEDYDYPMTPSELAEKTGVGTRSIQRRLRDLRDADLVERDRHSMDGRRYLWRIASDDAEGREATT